MIVMFICINILITTSVIFTMKSIKMMHSMFWLVLSFLFSSILLFLLNFHFLGMMLIFIYSGAITILFMFSMLMFNLNSKEKMNTTFTYESFFYLMGVFLLLILSMKFNMLIVDSSLDELDGLVYYKGEFFQLAHFLMNKLGWLIMACAIILLIPMLTVLLII